MGGLPGSGLNEVLLNRPFTAHILGGAPIGATPADGVLDGWQRVWTSPASTSSTAPRSAPTSARTRRSTIAAQAERAFAFWPAGARTIRARRSARATGGVEPVGLRDRAAERPLASTREHPADRALELVGDPAPLHDDVRAHGAMPVGKPQATKRGVHRSLQCSTTSAGWKCLEG